MHDALTERLANRSWRATLGPFEATAPTKRASLEALAAVIAAEPHNPKPYTRRVVSGDIWLLWRVPGAWVYETPSGCLVVSCRSRDETINAMEEHIAVYYDQTVAPPGD